MITLDPKASIFGFAYTDKKLFFRIENFTNDVTTELVREAIYSAIETWNKEINFDFEITDDMSKSIFYIQWIDRSYSQVVNNITYTYSDIGFGRSGRWAKANGISKQIIIQNKGKVIQKDRFIFLDDEFNWSVTGGCPDIETVALHEIGHILGLDHFNTRNSVMYDFSDRIFRKLKEIDKLAIKYVYPTFERYSQLVTNDLQNFKKHVSKRRSLSFFVTAVIDSQKYLRINVVKEKRIRGEFELQRETTSLNIGGRIKDVDLAASSRWTITASISTGSRLVLHSWNAPNTTTKQEDINLFDIYRYPNTSFFQGIKILEITSSLFIVGVRTSGSKLKLMVFTVDNYGKLKLRSEAAHSLDIIYRLVLTKANDINDNHLVSVVTRRPDGQVRMLMYKINNEGKTIFQGKSNLVDVTAVRGIDTVRDRHGRLITSFINQDHHLQFLSWKLNFVEENKIEIPVPLISNEESENVYELNMSSTQEGILCAVKDDKRTYRLINYKSSYNGEINRRGDSQGLIGAGGKNFKVHCDRDKTDNIICSMRDGSNHLKYILMKYVIRA